MHVEAIVASANPDIRPRWSESVPWCCERCPGHDGKRCLLTGFQPDSICEPAVRAVVEATEKAIGLSTASTRPE